MGLVSAGAVAFELSTDPRVSGWVDEAEKGLEQAKKELLEKFDKPAEKPEKVEKKAVPPPSVKKPISGKSDTKRKEQLEKAFSDVSRKKAEESNQPKDDKGDPSGK